jgi:hypothetical protein
VNVESFADVRVDPSLRYSVFERMEVATSKKQKRRWYFFILPVTVIVSILLAADVIMGIIELSTSPTTNRQTPHWALELFANLTISLSIAFGSCQITKQINRR